MTDDDRILLAEAMGWTNICMKYVAMEDKSYPFGCAPGNVNDKHLKEQIPDPFNSANDDYAVLEWMRDPNNVTEDQWRRFKDAMERKMYSYMLGDYARARLKVLKNE